MRKLLTYLFWKVHYACRPAPTSLESHVQRGIRTRLPWWKFRPVVFRNNEGSMWHIYLTEERSYTKRGMIEVDIHIGQDSGDIVGFNVWDETLRVGDAAKGE